MEQSDVERDPSPPGTGAQFIRALLIHAPDRVHEIAMRHAEIGPPPAVRARERLLVIEQRIRDAEWWGAGERELAYLNRQSAEARRELAVFVDAWLVEVALSLEEGGSACPGR